MGKAKPKIELTTEEKCFLDKVKAGEYICGGHSVSNSLKRQINIEAKTGILSIFHARVTPPEYIVVASDLYNKEIQKLKEEGNVDVNVFSRTQVRMIPVP